jgi:hypothetical protein
VFRGALQDDGALVSHCVFRVLDAHPTSLRLVRSGLECLGALAPGLSDPAAVLHQLLEHDPSEALCRDGARDLVLPLLLATSALQTRMVSVPVLAQRRSRVVHRLSRVALRVASDVCTRLLSCAYRLQDTLDARWSGMRRAWCAAVASAREHRARVQALSAPTNARPGIGSDVKRSRR